MELNSLLFPAPKSHYNKTLPGLILINKAFIFKDKIQAHPIEKFSTISTLQDEPQDVKIKYQNRGRSNTQISSYLSYNIPCRLYLDCTTDKIMVYFHGNAEDIETSYKFLSIIQSTLQITILAVEYPGYGVYLGETNCKQILQDSETIIDFLINNVGYKSQNISIFGRSIGTGPAAHVSTKYSLGNLVLMSPFTSIQSIINSYIGNFFGKFVQDRFRTIDIIDKIKCPIFICHGIKDSLIHFSQSQLLYNKISNKSRATIYLAPEMTHNYLDLETDFLLPYSTFLKTQIHQEKEKIQFIKLDTQTFGTKTSSRNQQEKAPTFPEECFNLQCLRYQTSGCFKFFF